MWGRRRSVAALATGLLLLAIVDVTAQQEQRSVLTLYAQRRENPVPVILDPLLQEILAQRLPGVDYYNEFIDGARFADPEFQHALRDFLKRKYAGRRFDALIAASSQALGFVKANRDELFAGVPVVFATSPSVETELGRTKVPEPRSTGVTSATDLARTLTMVTQLQPETKRVFVVSGSSAFDKLYEDRCAHAVPRVRRTVRVHLLVGAAHERSARARGGSPARLDPVSAHDHSGRQRAAVPAVRPDRAHRGCRERARLRVGLTRNGSRRGRRQHEQPGASGWTAGRTGHSSARRREAREHPCRPCRSQRQRS